MSSGLNQEDQYLIQIKKNNIYAGELMKQLNRPGMVKHYRLL